MSAGRAPNALLTELGITRPEGIDVDAIAHYCGATVIYETLRGCAARIVGKGDSAIITVNSADSLPRRRFSAGHELGHWMRDRHRIAFACDELAFATEWRRNNPERRANRFAADLLLPESLFREDARNLSITFDTVRELAGLYRTSLTATAIRLVEHGSYPSVIICSRRGERWKWFYRSSDLPRSVWPRDEPTSDSLAYEILRGEPDTAGEVSTIAWFDVPGAERYALREDTMRLTPDMTLSLLWWEDEAFLLASL